MLKKKLLELNKKGLDYGFVVPAGTQVIDIEKALACFIIDSSKYRNIKTTTFLAEISQWVQEIENNL